MTGAVLASDDSGKAAASSLPTLETEAKPRQPERRLSLDPPVSDRESSEAEI
jgi:hypothetical protein